MALLGHENRQKIFLPHSVIFAPHLPGSPFRFHILSDAAVIAKAALLVDNVDRYLTPGLALAGTRVAHRPRRNREISHLNISLSGATRLGAPAIPPRCLDKRLTAVKHVDNLWKRFSIGESALRAQSSGNSPRVE